MHVRRIETMEALEELSSSWNRLSRGVPFRSWQWMHAWWKAYGAGHRLYVLALESASRRLIAVAPLYLESTVKQGRTLKFLGSGEVCTDYQTILVQPANEPQAARALARWLAAAHDSPEDRWDFLELADVFSADTAVERLTFELQQHGCQVARRLGPQCWRASLPASWSDYVGRLNKSRRKSLRRLERRLEQDPRLSFWRPHSSDEFREAFCDLVRLHQLRWESQGAPGCFASERFSQFAERSLFHLWRAGRCQLTCLEHSQQTIAVQVDLMGDATVFSYQAGVDPSKLSLEPGHLLHAYTIRQAIEAGFEAFDFLRGDEAYKASWLATPRLCACLRVASPRSVEQSRHAAWLNGEAMNEWIQDELAWPGLAPCPLAAR